MVVITEAEVLKLGLQRFGESGHETTLGGACQAAKVVHPSTI